jgi:hypothetical protein
MLHLSKIQGLNSNTGNVMFLYMDIDDKSTINTSVDYNESDKNYWMLMLPNNKIMIKRKAR